MTNQMHETIDSSVALALHNKNQEVEWFIYFGLY